MGFGVFPFRREQCTLLINCVLCINMQICLHAGRTAVFWFILVFLLMSDSKTTVFAIRIKRYRYKGLGRKPVKLTEQKLNDIQLENNS
jgi:hypothetical protein